MLMCGMCSVMCIYGGVWHIYVCGMCGVYVYVEGVAYICLYGVYLCMCVCNVYVYVAYIYVCVIFIHVVCMCVWYVGYVFIWGVIYIYVCVVYGWGCGSVGCMLYLLKDHSSSLVHSLPGSFADSQGPWLCVS